MGTQKKDKYIHIRIDEDLKSDFIDYCDGKLITPSKLVREFIKKTLLDNEKDK